ncbi:putative C-terminal domain small phosphatase isoform X1 [Capsicum galapagoense]
MYALSTEDSVTKSAELISKRKRKTARYRANRKERKQRLDQMLKNVSAPKSEESSVEDVASLENSNSQLLPLGHLEIQTESAPTLLEKTPVKKKRRKKRSVMKALNKEVDPCSMDQNNVPSNPSLPDKKHGEVENGLLNPNISIEDVASLENSDAQLLPLGHQEIQTEVTTTLLEKGPVKKKKRRKRKLMKALNKSELVMQVNSAPITPGDLCMMTGCRLRRKLLILDVNGLLADIVNPPPKDCNPDACFARRAIFKRPYCNDFLKFCFERFDVGIWSSRSKKIIVKVVDYLLGNMKHKLLFCWDMSHSTQTMFKTLENKHKPLVCKELSKVWDRYDPNLPWERGDYDESNTLLLDDSPYKALLNPVHTAIFPLSYHYKVENDNSLGPGGDLRIYLEELLKAEHVQKYVEQHPFGQRAIDQTSSDWNFYSDVLSSLLGQSGLDS